MSVLCHAPDCGREIADGDRRVQIQLAVDWGKDDLRDAHEKGVTFHSFGCLSDWAAEKASDHDGHVLQEGVSDAP